MDNAGSVLTDAQASQATAIYPQMRYDNALIKAGTRVNWNGVLKRAAVDLWDAERNNPDNAPTLWEDINYRDGYRAIPETITAGTAFAKDEIGWWGRCAIPQSDRRERVTPEQYPAGWEVYSA